MQARWKMQCLALGRLLCICSCKCGSIIFQKYICCEVRLESFNVFDSFKFVLICPCCFAAILLIELSWLVVGVVWVSQHYQSCTASSAKRAILGKLRISMNIHWAIYVGNNVNSKSKLLRCNKLDNSLLLSPAAPETRDERYSNAPHLDIFSQNFAGTCTMLFFLHYFMFSSRFMLHVFPTFKQKNWCKKNSGGGGGGVFIISFRVLCYFQH